MAAPRKQPKRSLLDAAARTVDRIADSEGKKHTRLVIDVGLAIFAMTICFQVGVAFSRIQRNTEREARNLELLEQIRAGQVKLDERISHAETSIQDLRQQTRDQMYFNHDGGRHDYLDPAHQGEPPVHTGASGGG